MSQCVDHYCFAKEIPADEIRDTLRLATLATESVYGRQRTLAEANFDLNDDHVCWIDASNEVGEHLSRVFAGFARREFGQGVCSLRSQAVPVPQ